jgi:hypothetical protein
MMMVATATKFMTAALKMCTVTAATAIHFIVIRNVN